MCVCVCVCVYVCVCVCVLERERDSSPVFGRTMTPYPPPPPSPLSDYLALSLSLCSQVPGSPSAYSPGSAQSDISSSNPFHTENSSPSPSPSPPSGGSTHTHEKNNNKPNFYLHTDLSGEDLVTHSSVSSQQGCIRLCCLDGSRDSLSATVFVSLLMVSEMMSRSV